MAPTAAVSSVLQSISALACGIGQGQGFVAAAVDPEFPSIGLRHQAIAANAAPAQLPLLDHRMVRLSSAS